MYAGYYTRLKLIKPTIVEHMPSPWSIQDCYSVNTTAVLQPGRPFPNMFTHQRYPLYLNSPTQPMPSFQGCFFCGEQVHMVHDCPVAAQYIQDNKCQINQYNHYVHADLMPIIVRNGTTLKAAIDSSARCTSTSEAKG